MTDLSRLKHLAGLTETISENPRMNDKIEQVLSQFDKAEQTKLLSAMEALKDSGPNGLTPREWMERYAGYHLDATGAKDVLTMVAKNFGFCIKRVAGAEGARYAWVEDAIPDPVDQSQDPEMDPYMKQMVSSQVSLTYDALAAMREMGEFSREDVSQWLSRRGLPPEQTIMYADHLIDKFGAVPVAPGRYRLPTEEPVTNDGTMNMLRDLANRAAATGRIDGE